MSYDKSQIQIQENQSRYFLHNQVQLKNGIATVRNKLGREIYKKTSKVETDVGFRHFAQNAHEVSHILLISYFEGSGGKKIKQAAVANEFLVSSIKSPFSPDDYVSNKLFTKDGIRDFLFIELSHIIKNKLINEGELSISQADSFELYVTRKEGDRYTRTWKPEFHEYRKRFNLNFDLEDIYRLVELGQEIGRYIKTNDSQIAKEIIYLEEDMCKWQKDFVEQSKSQYYEFVHTHIYDFINQLIFKGQQLCLTEFTLLIYTIVTSIPLKDRKEFRFSKIKVLYSSISSSFEAVDVSYVLRDSITVPITLQLLHLIGLEEVLPDNETYSYEIKSFFYPRERLKVIIESINDVIDNLPDFMKN